MASELTPEAINECKEAFSLFDQDNDGCIAIQLLPTLFRSMGLRVSDTQTQELIHECCCDPGRGIMDLPEFLRMISSAQVVSSQQESAIESAREVFKSMDAGGKGYITEVEFRRCCASMGYCLTEQEIVEAWTELDVNRDGMIRFEQFARLFQP